MFSRQDQTAQGKTTRNNKELIWLDRQTYPSLHASLYILPFEESVRLYREHRPV